MSAVKDHFNKLNNAVPSVTLTTKCVENHWWFLFNH